MNELQHALTDSGARPRSVLGQWNVGKVAQTKRPRSHRIGRVLVGLVGLVVVASLAGSVYESVAEAADVRAYPPPGRMIDVGGHRLHINCVGTGTPTVVIDAGLGRFFRRMEQLGTAGSGQDYAGLHRTTAREWATASPGTLPRTAERFAQELHTLLSGADVPGPYVLVGHSSGGLPVRVFAHAYAAEVAGVVLIESMSPSGAKPSTSATPTQSDSRSIADWALTLPARTGLLRLLAGPLQLNAGLSPEVANAYTAVSVTPRYLADVAGRRQGDAGKPGPGWRCQKLRNPTPDCALERTQSGRGSGLAEDAIRAPRIVIQQPTTVRRQERTQRPARPTGGRGRGHREYGRADSPTGVAGRSMRSTQEVRRRRPGAGWGCGAVALNVATARAADTSSPPSIPSFLFLVRLIPRVPSCLGPHLLSGDRPLCLLELRRGDLTSGVALSKHVQGPGLARIAARPD